MMSKIHPTAIIDSQVRLGNDVEIGPFCIIENDVEIGDNVFIGARVTIHSGSRIGNGTRILDGAIIGMEPQDLKYKGEKTLVIIGENTQIRQMAAIERGTATGTGYTTVGNNTLIMSLAHIAHDCQVGNNVIISHGSGLAGHVIVEDRVVIGGLAGVHQFCRVGAMAMIGGVSKVTKNVPPYILVDGIPAKAASVNIVGLRRGGLTPEVRAEIKKAYKILYRNGNTVSQAIEEIEQNLQGYPEIDHFLRFLRDVGRGICAARKQDDSESEGE
jgi:UDP-N-acetylglucosamine acyltransferase